MIEIHLQHCVFCSFFVSVGKKFRGLSCCIKLQEKLTRRIMPLMFLTIVFAFPTAYCTAQSLANGTSESVINSQDDDNKSENVNKMLYQAERIISVQIQDSNPKPKIQCRKGTSKFLHLKKVPGSKHFLM